MNNLRLYNSDCRHMTELSDESVQMACTSPPYWGLRRYAGLPDDQFGLEPTVQMYVAHTVDILREVRRVLRKDGVAFWNLGDSYSGSGKGIGSDHGKAVFTDADIVKLPNSPGLKPKDLCLIPFRVALAAQDDGWWVRSVIIWSKNNPMPESVTDRPTESHEYILMLTKAARYYWDQEAVREPHPESYFERMKYPVSDHRGNGGQSWVETKDNPMRKILEPTSGRNLRSVWEFPTQPYRKAHFATFPEALPERCIKAATPEVGSCPKCGGPWVRVQEVNGLVQSGHVSPTDRNVHADIPGNVLSATSSLRTGLQRSFQSLGWRASCKCGLPQEQNVPAVVLDPFAGSGTTLAVARRMGRQAVGYELSAEYCKLIEERNAQGVL